MSIEMKAGGFNEICIKINAKTKLKTSNHMS